MIDEQYIERLKSYIFRKTGKHYLNKIKPTTSDFMVSCPFHKDGQERKPSCGIKRFTTEKGVEGTVHCFSCGYTTDIEGLLQYVLGDLYDSTEADTLFNVSSLKVQGAFYKPSELNLFELPKKQTYISKSIIKKYKKYHPYLQQRRIDESTAFKYDLGYDSINNHIIFPIKDKYNNCIALGRRAITYKQYIYPPGFKKPLYGVYELPEKIVSLFVVEGPFNLWSLSEWHRNGVALLGTGTEYQYNQLLEIPCDQYVLALDPDDAGIHGTYKLGCFLTDMNRKVFVCLMPKNKDINDLTYSEFNNVQVVSFNTWLQINKSNLKE